MTDTVLQTGVREDLRQGRHLALLLLGDHEPGRGLQLGQLQPEVLPAQLGEGGLQRRGQRLEVGRGDTLHPDRVVVNVELVKYVLACNEINTVLLSYK